MYDVTITLADSRQFIVTFPTLFRAARWLLLVLHVAPVVAVSVRP